MKHVKRLFSLLLVCVLLVGLMPQISAAGSSFRLGTDSAELLSGGGRRVAADGGEYIIGEDGFVYFRQNGEDTLAVDLQAGNLNYDSGCLYFTVQEEGRFSLYAYDGSLSCLHSAPGTVKQFCLVNGDTAYYSVGDAVWMLPLGGKASICFTDEALFSFVPTPYGLVTARGTAAEYAVYAGICEAVPFCDRYSVEFTNGGKLVYHDSTGDHQLDLKNAFAGKAAPEAYEGLGTVDMAALLSADYDASEEELAAETQTARNAAANNKRALNGPQASASAIRGTLTQGQKNAQKRAYQMTDIQWTPKANILGWDSGLTYTSGTTYTGLPYGQPVNASYVPWSTDLTGFITNVNNASSKMYTDYSAYNKRAPYYSTDCSAFVSWALNMDSRKTTASIAGTSLATLISETSYANIQVGDFLNKSGSHVVICTDITYDSNGNINGIEISEATVVAATNYCCQRTWYGTDFGSNTLSYFTTKYFGGGYKLYRSKTIANVSYSHVCVSPVAGDVCSVCGYGSTGNDTGSDSGTKFGIDVSYAQGTINWDLVAPQIDFAILRCGYGSDITTQDDNQWARNVSECERLGIPYGVYLFSYADTDAKAASEAQHVLRLLEGHHPTLPVFYDLEASGTQACGNAAILNFAKIFCGAIEDAGYDAGVYANLNWWRNYLTSSEYDQWYRWVAQYNTSCTYTGTYCMWQNSSTYTMNGITGNTVDTDYWYGAFPGQDTPPVSGDYTVTFKVPTDYASVPAQGVTAGSSITLPSISTKHCGYTFMGWTTSAVSATTEQPEFYYAGQSFTPTKNTTLRAVFKYYKNGNSVVGDIYYPPCSSSQTGLNAGLSESGATDTSYAYRRDHVAVENFVYNYGGTADQNTYLLGLLKAGMLVDPAKTASLTAYYNTTPGVCHRATTETTVAATCTTSGTKVTSCAYCGYSKTTEVAALGHNDKYVSNGNGTHTHSCSRCDTVLAAAEACTFESGYCTLCGGAQTAADFSGTFYIAAKRTNDTNYQYLTNTVSSNRLSIEDSGVTVLPASIASPDANKTFSIIADGSGKYTIRADGTAGTTNYIGWKQATSTAANNAILVAQDSAVHADITGSSAGYVNISFTDSAETLRYLAFNSTATNRYCCWYASQMKNLYLIPVTGSLPAHTHSYTSSVTTEPTCTTAGVLTYTCECSDSYTEPIPALQHDYIYHYVDPTCTERGYTRATCSRCDFDEILDYSYVDALGHDWNAQTPVPATCTEEGYTPLVCSRCDATDLTDIVEELGHSYDYLDNGNGTHKYYCTRCETVFDAAEECVYDDGVCIGCGHVQVTASYGDFVLVTEAPADWSGSYLIVCNDKSAAFDGSLATPYAKTNYNTVTISDGVITGSTTVRSYAVTIEKVSGTDYYTIKLGSNKYMGSTGSSTGINASASTKYQNSITLDASGNAVIANTTGTNTYNFRFNTASASDRFAFFGTSTGKPVQLYKYIECPHSYDSGVETTAATCTENGVKTFTCSLCGDTYTEPIAALGHDYVYGAEQNGTVTGTCSNCGDHLYRYRVSYSVPAFATAPESVLVDGGDTIAVLPEVETVCGYVQMGWVSAPIAEASTEPTFFQKGCAYTVNAPVTLYAVYAYYKDNGELTGNIYYPACADSYSSIYYALESVAAGTGSLSYRENSIAPAMYIYNYTGSTAQNNALVALLKSGMVIDPALVAGYTKYYTTAPAACLRAILTDNGNGTHTAACAHCGYTLTEAHAYADGVCACSARLQSLGITSAALVLNGKIDVVYTAEIPDGYTDARMVFTMNSKTETVYDDGTHTFTFTGVNPQCMGDNISATLYATKNGTEESVSKNDYSVRRYCVSMLSKTTDAKLRTLLSDILAYGAAAQTYMSYKTGALVNTGSDIVNPSYSTFTSLSGLAASFTGTAVDGLAWAGAGLTLTDGVAMNFRFYAASTSGLSVRVTLNGETQTFTASNFTAVSGMTDVYEISFTGIGADEFADAVSASFYRNNVKTGETLSYSVNTYVCAKQADSSTTLANLVRALYNYGASAEAFAG